MKNSSFGMTVLDAGHKYRLNSLDGEHRQVIQFVKRHDLKDPSRFPRNNSSYPGATLQMVIRVLLDRTAYLQSQIWCWQNVLIIKLLEASIWLLELRAAIRHGKMYWHGIKYAATTPICNKCGHTQCKH